METLRTLRFIIYSDWLGNDVEIPPTSNIMAYSTKLFLLHGVMHQDQLISIFAITLTLTFSAQINSS